MADLNISNLLSGSYVGNPGATGATGFQGASGSTGITGATGILTAWTLVTTTTTLAKNAQYIIDTTSGSFTVTLPASPSLGDQVIVQDGGNFSTNNLTIARNGSTIEGQADNILADIGGVLMTLIYDGSTWQISINTGAAGASGPSGASGINGASGTIGVDGASGANGATGSAGTNGASGVGATGVTGASGTIGVDGATGVQGASGSTGLTGATGTQSIAYNSAYTAQFGTLTGATGATGSVQVSGTLTSAQVAASNGIFVNNMTIAASYTIPTGYGANSVGAVTINSGVVVTIPSGSRWVVL